MAFDPAFHERVNAPAPGWYRWPSQPLTLWKSHAVYLWWDGGKWADQVYTRSDTFPLARHRSVISTEAIAVGALGGVFAGTVLLLDLFLVANLWLGGAVSWSAPDVIWVLLSIAGYLVGGFALYNGIRARKHLRSLPPANPGP